MSDEEVLARLFSLVVKADVSREVVDRFKRQNYMRNRVMDPRAIVGAATLARHVLDARWIRQCDAELMARVALILVDEVMRRGESIIGLRKQYHEVQSLLFRSLCFDEVPEDA